MKYSVEEILKMKNAGMSDEAIVAIVTGGSKSSGSNSNGNKIGTGAKAPTTEKQYSVDIKDYEPKKQDSNYNWVSYKARRSAYCYAVATGGACNKNPYGSAWAEAGNKVDYSPDGAYYKAKAEFEATYKYIAKVNR